MARRALLVGLEHLRPKDPRMSLGMASIVANLRRLDLPHDTHTFNVGDGAFDAPTAFAPLVDAAMAHGNRTDVIVGAFVWNEPYIHTLLADLRRKGFPGRIGVAGPQVSYAEAGELERAYPLADFFIRGFAEQAVAELQLGATRPRGVHLRGEPDLGIQASPDFDALPSPHLDGVIAPGKFIRWETQRGCPFACSFCQHRKKEKGVNALGSARVAAEIKFFCEQAPGADIAVLDPTFNTSTAHAVAVLNTF
ncbi:hypothetical protein T484DRAFT_1840996 [Baffinella frigidus]|nr:hypothetical protein T484DRAFT_1840996 [Cryptophyta sp. CCMP2293]